MHPASLINGGGRGLGILPIPQHDAITTRTEFARLTNWHHLAGGRIDNLNFQMRSNQATRPDTLLQRRVDTGLG